ncbi:DegT/DnrJ/EryC1/StrS family aminotransferase [Hymenobacter cheonanensis]|uniref:DegT/DnrJ/EryC1/StrS family aminotransferase n=1 Tax=Hymenobacter sp. CA2-7 TaxID=3063993 RepID=UPI0027140197|nr:DegT/DnrJ/EryC1/StrS family aminotransferase [Hymenobacter sp. CA2-7]MDO7884410.1 DegT/DnrJ/EryC1/StrS family aminotransferase [Hymenobacter sp. CA2-7]
MSAPVIPFFSMHAMHAAVRAETLATMARVYDAEWYVLGEELALFEQEYSAFSQVAHTVGVGNGLEALTLALRALDIGPGDEVLVPSNTYIATWLAVSHAGAVPVPVEPDPATSNLDPSRLEAAITARTRAVLPVHLYGQPCRMTEIMALARRYHLTVIEDNAQAQGAAFEGQLTGSFGIASGTSFYPTKNLGALGDAGAITTSDPGLAQRLRQLRNYGSDQKNHHQLPGYNSRLDELQAAVLRIKLRHLPTWTAQRRQLAVWYSQYLAGLPGLRLPAVAPGAEPVWHLYVVHCPQRDALQRHLAAGGIGTLIHYPVPPHRQPAYASLGLAAGSLPIAETLAATCLSLPLWPGMQEETVATIAASIRRFFAGAS